MKQPNQYKPYAEDEEFRLLEVILDHSGSTFSKARKLSKEFKRPYYGVLRKIYRVIEDIKRDGVNI